MSQTTNDAIVAQVKQETGAKTVRALQKGFSTHDKYVLDERLLLRIFPIEEQEARRKEFETLKQLDVYSSDVPTAYKFQTCPEVVRAYMLLSYIPGVDGEEVLPTLSKDAQYHVGYEAGQMLVQLHECPAPADVSPWYEHKKNKSDRYIDAFEEMSFERTFKETLVRAIRERETLMKGRPNRFQHDDVYPGNIIIHQGRFAGLIDFGQYDWGDPLHDLCKLGFFSKAVSTPFTTGVIDGYHGGKTPTDHFWSLYALYSAMHAVSAVVWIARNDRSSEDEEMFATYAREVVADHDDFRSDKPRWYK